MLSIITVVLNDKAGLLKTMESVFNQKYSDFEYVVIDGGSTDGTLEVIKGNEDKIAYWQSEKDNGIYNAMNKGIAKAKGTYIGFMNAGDFYVDNVFENIFVRENIGADILYGDQYFIKDNNQLVLKTKPAKLSMYDFYWGSLYHQASFIKRTLFETDLYNEDLRIISDAEFYLKKIIFDEVSYKHVGLAISYYNTLGLSSSPKAKGIISKEREYLHKKYFNKQSLVDYEMLREYKKSSLFELIPELNQTNRFGHYIGKVVSCHLWIYRKLKKAKN